MPIHRTTRAPRSQYLHPKASVTAPGAIEKGRHEHRWRSVADGQGRLCVVCGRGEQKKGRGWKLVQNGQLLPRRTKR